MLRLYRTNLEVRLRCVDQTALQSEGQKQIYSTVSELLKSFTQTATTARDLEWDETYKAERLISLLFSGAQLRQEISARLQELAAENLKDGESLRRDYETLLKPPGDNQASQVDDAMLRVFLLRGGNQDHSGVRHYLLFFGHCALCPLELLGADPGRPVVVAVCTVYGSDFGVTRSIF